MKLSILDSTGLVYDEEVDRFLVKSQKGPLEVAPGYADCYEALEADGVLKAASSQGPAYFAIHHGLLEVKRGRARVVCLYAEDGKKIDVARATASKERAEQRLTDSNLDIVRAKAALSRALSRLEASRLSLGSK